MIIFYNITHQRRYAVFYKITITQIIIFNCVNNYPSVCNDYFL